MKHQTNNNLIFHFQSKSKAERLPWWCRRFLSRWAWFFMWAKVNARDYRRRNMLLWGKIYAYVSFCSRLVILPILYNKFIFGYYFQLPYKPLEMKNVRTTKLYTATVKSLTYLCFKYRYLTWYTSKVLHYMVEIMFSASTTCWSLRAVLPKQHAGMSEGIWFRRGLNLCLEPRHLHQWRRVSRFLCKSERSHRVILHVLQHHKQQL